MKISVRKTSLVKPAEKTRHQSIKLTQLDRTFEFPRQNSVVYIYEKKSEANYAEIMRESLSKTLVYFYPMAGRGKVDEFGFKEIECNDKGALFVEAETESTIENIVGDLAPSPETSILVPPVEFDPDDISTYPLLAVQVTYFKCGGVSLGIRMEHQITDGASAFNLTKSWSEIARGLEISLLPFIDRNSVICPRDPPQPKFEHLEYSRYVPPSPGAKKHVVKVSVLEVSRETLDRMKGDTHSTFEALAGHIWRCVSKARGLRPDEEAWLMFKVNLRFNRLKPAMPRGFFGNAVMRTLAVSSGGDLESNPLSYAADQIHKASVRMDNEYARSALDHIATLPDFWAAKAGPHMNERPNFQVTSWAKLGLDDANFGWGQPKYTIPGNIKSEKAYIFPSNHNVGGLSVAIALRVEHMEMFEKLFSEL